MANNKHEPTPAPTSPAIIRPRNSAEVTQMISVLKLQRSAFESQQDGIGRAIFELAPAFTQNDPAAVARMRELEELEKKVVQHIRLCDLSMEQALQLHQVMVVREAEEQEQSRKKNYEAALLSALAEARHSDRALEQYASHMRARAGFLQQAQMFAVTPTELGQLRQLASPQGPTWALGHFGCGRLFESGSLAYATNFATLEAYSTPRLPGYGLNDNANTDTKEQPAGTNPDPAPLPVEKAGSDKAGKGRRIN